jgi:ribosome biogenesis GTPase
MPLTGLVTSRHRRHVIVEPSEGERCRCLVLGRDLKPLVGDSVVVEQQVDGTMFVSKLLPRDAVLTRIDSRGNPEGVAANISQLAVVIADKPAPDWSLVDRYFAAAELEGIGGLLIWNKSDLVGLDSTPEALVYRPIGYSIIETSAKLDTGLANLEAALASHRSVLVGQSGVGKSSLINGLLGSDAQVIGALSERRSLGRHTTTAAELYRLRGGGELIDSPGVRQFAPYLRDPEELDRGYREFQQYLGQCRFDNCRHEAEPDCAVKTAVKDEQISATRYAGYLRLRTILMQIKAKDDRGRQH